MANKYRSEYNLKISGETILLRPTFQALAEIEGVLGKSLWTILQGCEKDGFSYQEIKAMISASSVEKPVKNLEDLILKEGGMSLTKQLIEFLYESIR